MPNVELALPPGLYRNGTQYQARGRWYDGSLVRWSGGAMQPVGGWADVSFTGNDIVASENGTTAWGGDTLGAAPSGWTEYQARGSEPNALQDWTVETDASASQGRVLYNPDTNNVYAGTLVWDTVTAYADGEVLAEVVVPSNTASIGVCARHNDAQPTTMISAHIRRIGSSYYLYVTYGNNVADLTDPAASVIDNPIITGPVPVAGEYWQIRFNFNGTAVKAKTWKTGTSEPSSWLVDTTDGTMTTAAGLIGVYAASAINLAPQSIGFLAYDSGAGETATAPSVPAETITPAATDVGGQTLGALAWRDNANVPWLALGTPTQCWIYSEGLISDVTPAGFTTGLADGSTQIAGYGTGAYGAGVYNEGVAQSVGTVLEAQNWQFDNFGEFLIAQAHSDGNLYQWQPNVDTELQQITNSPTDCLGVVVTPERFIVALGANGDPRNVVWADQQSLTNWTSVPENQAGDFVLASAGTLMAGQRTRDLTLLWTTNDLWTMQFIGGGIIYSFAQAGTNCGLIGRRAYSMIDGTRAMWMGTDSFYLFDGGVIPVPSEVGDDVFNDINTEQASKIFAVTISEYSEVWFFYPSTGSTDVDKYVSFNYAENHWAMGDLERTAGVPRGAFTSPMMMDRNGKIYNHELGTTYFDLDGVTALVPFAESGPFVISSGDNTMWVRYVIPDENTLGDMTAYLKTRLYPTATEASFGPFTLAEPTPTRVSGRQVVFRVEQVTAGWRFGTPILEVVPAGMR